MLSGSLTDAWNNAEKQKNLRKTGLLRFWMARGMYINMYMCMYVCMNVWMYGLMDIWRNSNQYFCLPMRNVNSFEINHISK